MKPNNKMLEIKILNIVNLIPLLPCVYLTIHKIMYVILHTWNSSWIWSHSFLGATLPVVFLRCFYLPYITSVILIGTYVYFLIKNRAPIKEWIIFAGILIICVLGLISVEAVFWAAMGI